MADDFVVWEDRFNVGIVMIDEQHRRLVDFTNALFDGCRQGKEGANEAFRKVLRDVVAYVKVHFSSEEQLMQEMGWDGFAAHKKQHEEFVRRVLEDVANFEGGQNFVPNLFVRFLRDWLLEHIAVADHEFSGWDIPRGAK